jgi:hypothetical protein
MQGGPNKVGVNVNNFESYISSLVTGDFAKRGAVWMKATPVGLAQPDPASVNDLGWPTEPAVSQVTTPGWQRQATSVIGSAPPLVLRYKRGTLPPFGTPGTVTDVVLVGDLSTPPPGDVVLVPPISIDQSTGIVTKRYYTDHAGPLSIFVRQVNSIDTLVDMDIELWADATHQSAQTANPEEAFFSKYVERLQELQPGFLRTMPWSNNRGASESVLVG